jgi:hypothetical protein
MSPNLVRLIDELRERVGKLERQRSKRGVTNQKGAAAYLDRSTEWLRQMERRGIGPLRYPNGEYPYDGLDEFLLARRETLPRPTEPADLPAELPQSEGTPRVTSGRIGSAFRRATQQTAGRRGQAAAE